MMPLVSLFALVAGLSPAPDDLFPADGLFTDPITEAAQISARVADFDRGLRDSGLPGRVRSCTMVVDVTQGRVSSNHSYGAICSIQFSGKKAGDYLVCNDKMVGHFALTSSYVVARDWVAEFVKKNCVGG